MIRKTLTILSTTGLLFSVGLWGVSYQRVLFQSVTYIAQGSTTVFSADLVHVLAIDGKIQIDYGTIPARPPKPTSRIVAKIKSTFPEGTRWSFGSDITGTPGIASWQWLPSAQRSGVTTILSLPVYLLTIITAALPCHHTLAVYRRRKRKKLGLCLKCGYDLRGSEDRCPECRMEFDSSGVEELGSSADGVDD